MSTFNQQGQQVQNQHNIGGDQNIGGNQKMESGDANFGEVRQELLQNLEDLKGQLADARQAGAINEDTETEAKYNITKAAQIAKEPEPDKHSLLDYLGKAKDCFDGIEKVGGIVALLVKSYGLVQGLPL